MGCFFFLQRNKKQNKKKNTLFSRGDCFYFDFTHKQSTSVFWPSGAYVQYVCPDTHVMAFSCSQSNETFESPRSGNVFSLIQRDVHPSIDLTDRQTDWPSVNCICVVLLYSKRNWMIRLCVCFIIRYPFYVCAMGPCRDCVQYDRRIMEMEVQDI